jgi:hypothetical protein
MLVRIQILGSAPLTIGSGSGSVPQTSVTFRMQKIYFFHIFKCLLNEFKNFKIVKICLMIKIKYLTRKLFVLKFYFGTIIWSAQYFYENNQKMEGSYGSGSGTPAF